LAKFIVGWVLIFEVKVGIFGRLWVLLVKIDQNGSGMFSRIEKTSS